MSRLQAQCWRLYSHLPQTDAPTGEAEPPRLIDEQGLVRSMVLELARPADWPTMARVWHGVQEELNLPAPAIAVNGMDGYQLWFSVSAAITVAEAQAFLVQLRDRYLADIPNARLSLMPSAKGGTPPHWRHANAVPAPARTAGQWSAFVKRDLAPVFDDSPWLDIPPNPDGQAELLSALQSMERIDLLDLLSTWAPSSPPSAPSPAPTGEPPVLRQDPCQFLLGVMNDPTVELALRIEAAKALLHHPPVRQAP